MNKKSRKVFNNRYRKIRNRVIVCILLALLILAFWNYISDLHKHIDLLAKYNHEQSMEIHNLEHANAKLSNTVTNLQHQVTYITNKETSSIKVQYRKVDTTPNATPVNNNNSIISDAFTYTPTVIITAVTIIGGMVKNLIPSF